MINRAVNLCWWKMATRHHWAETALLQTDMRWGNTGEISGQLMLHNSVTIDCAVTPGSNEQTCRLFFLALEQRISMEKAEGLLCSLAHHWHVSVLLYYSLVCCSTQTAIQLPCKLLWLNVLPSTLVNERCFFFFLVKRAAILCICVGLAWASLNELILTHYDIWLLEEGKSPT